MHLLWDNSELENENVSNISHPRDAVRLRPLVPGNNSTAGSTVYFNKSAEKWRFRTDFKDKYEQRAVCNSILRVKICLTLRPQAAQRAGLHCGIRFIS